MVLISKENNATRGFTAECDGFMSKIANGSGVVNLYVRINRSVACYRKSQCMIRDDGLALLYSFFYSVTKDAKPFSCFSNGF